MMLLDELLGILILRNRLGGLPGLKLTMLSSLGETQFRSTAAQHTVALKHSSLGK